MRRTGLVLIAFVAVLAAAAPLVSPHDPATKYDDRMHAPPTRLHLRDEAGNWHWPFFHPLRLADRLESRFEEDASRTVRLKLFTRGVLIAEEDPAAGLWLPLGADSYGRDLFARILYGARVSLGVSLLAVLGSLLLGVIVGSVAGYFGGALDEALMRLAEMVVVLPTVYLVLALRAVLPLVLEPAQIFALMAGIFALVGWPFVARGVRGIVASERRREYAEAARAAGAGHARILVRHLLPATAGHLGIQATLLLPAFILAEATLSFVGVGFLDPTPTWGTMLHDAASVSALAQFPWLLAPAGGIFVVVLGVNLVVQGSRGERRARALRHVW
jgi:peptide/nickel transport system permease protein